MLLQLSRRRPEGYHVALRDVNATTGIVVVAPDGRVGSVWLLDVADDKITAVHAVRNPEKLTSFRLLPRNLSGRLRASCRPMGQIIAEPLGLAQHGEPGATG